MISEEECHLNFEIIGHEPTIADLHRMFASLKINFLQNSKTIVFPDLESDSNIDYDSSLSLLSQYEETKLEIVNLITSHS